MERATIDRLLALPSNPRSDSDFTEGDRQFVDSIHRSILGSPVRDCTCRNRYADAYYEIMAAMPQEIRKLVKMSNQKKYRLIPGYVIYHEGSHYTNVTLTDEIAKAYLAKHPDAAKQFEAIPEPEVEEEPTPEVVEKPEQDKAKKSKK